MSSDTFILKHHSYILGKNKKIFAFRKLPDVGLIKKNFVNPSEHNIISVSKKVHYLIKSHSIYENQSGAYIEKIDLESFFFKLKANQLDLFLVDYVIEQESKILMIGSSKIESEDEQDFDTKKHFEYLFNK